MVSVVILSAVNIAVLEEEIAREVMPLATGLSRLLEINNLGRIGEDIENTIR